jgi:hypothetical protein
LATEVLKASSKMFEHPNSSFKNSYLSAKQHTLCFIAGS